MVTHVKYTWTDIEKVLRKVINRPSQDLLFDRICTLIHNSLASSSPYMNKIHLIYINLEIPMSTKAILNNCRYTGF